MPALHWIPFPPYYTSTILNYLKNINILCFLLPVSPLKCWGFFPHKILIGKSSRKNEGEGCREIVPYIARRMHVSLDKTTILIFLKIYIIYRHTSLPFSLPISLCLPSKKNVLYSATSTSRLLLLTDN